MVSVALDGANIDHLVLDEDITVRVGRTEVLQLGQPGSASLVLWLADWVDVGLGSTVEIAEQDGVRFAGKVSDVPSARWETDPDDPDGWRMLLRLQAVGPLAAWGRRRIGDEPWPAETVAERAARIAALAGAPLVVEGGATMRVIGRDVDSQPAVAVLEDLAVDAAGWLYDHRGSTYLQTLDHRRRYDPQERWDDQAQTWDAWDGTWDEQTEPTGLDSPTVYLPPDAVLFAPELEQTSRIANDITVRYGPEDEYGDQASAHMTDTDSVAAHGPQQVRITTRLEALADAELRAALTLERAAWPRWHVPRATVACDLLDPQTLAVIDGMHPGARCQVTGLPEPGPFQMFDGCVEGWTEQWSWDDAFGAVLRTFTLHLSDVRWSFAVLTWDGIVPDTLAWDDIDCTWDQMITADDLEGAA